MSLGNRDKAQELLDAVLDLRSRKKMGGKDLPTKMLNWKKARRAHQGAPPHVVLAVPSPFLPAVDEKHVVSAEASTDLNTPDEHALHLLLLCIMHRTLHLYAPACALLEATRGTQGTKEAYAADKGKVGVGMEKKKKAGLDKKGWACVLAGADAELDRALGIAGKSDINLSSRLDSRIALLTRLSRSTMVRL
ncbi:hypothetical protein C8R44DRAFT_888737 [Mycena epipterygia]|nr:hypothetical protein C8R44DRAFT_888737 [Mycena epipterygia]